MTKNEIKMVIPQYISITRSFSQKVNPDNYGIDGEKYSPRDFFASIGDNIPSEEATPEKISEVSNRLYLLAKNEVEYAVEKYIEELKGSKPHPLSGEELSAISEFVKMIAAGTNMDDVVAKITEVKDKLNEGQLSFLRNLVKTSYKVID